MTKTITAAKFLRKKYKRIALGGAFAASFGQPERGASWLVYGESGSGKTEFMVQLAKEMAHHGRVLYVSSEQGDSSSLQMVFKRNEIAATRRITLGVDYTINTLHDTLNAKRPPATVIIDSIDYLEMTKNDYKTLIKAFPNINIILVSWAYNGKPKTSKAKDIEYMVDVKVEVRKYVAHPRSRFGGNAPYIIWAERAKQLNPFLNQGGFD